MSKNKRYRITRMTGQGNQVGCGSAATLEAAKRKAKRALKPRDVAAKIEREDYTPDGRLFALHKSGIVFGKSWRGKK